jgi:hypothetical protein
MQGIRDIFTIGGRRRSEGQDTPTKRQEQWSEREKRSLGEFSLISRERERDTRLAAVVQFALRGASNTTIQQPEGTPPNIWGYGGGSSRANGGLSGPKCWTSAISNRHTTSPPPVLRLQLSHCMVGNRNRGGNKAKPKMASGHTGRYN